VRREGWGTRGGGAARACTCADGPRGCGWCRCDTRQQYGCVSWRGGKVELPLSEATVALGGEWRNGRESQMLRGCRGL
jgi:hypothetical protein